MSPTQRTLAHLRKSGWVAEVVERWIPGANIRKDLLGIIDIVACNGEAILGVQATSASNVSARVQKAKAEPKLAIWKASGGRFAVIGWAKSGNRWGAKWVEL